MDAKEKFIQEFQAELENALLPERLAGTYRPESCLTHREDGEVWLLRDKSGERYILKTDSTGRRSLAGEFALLGQLLQELEGRVPRPVDCFEEGGVWYLLRTYLPGNSLAEIQEREGPFSTRRCAEVGAELCGLLDRLHRMDPPVIHRDIKPENIILSPEGKPCLIDFDIARSYKDGQDSDTTFMGTRRTAAPEQYGYAQTDGRTDLYALGVTLCWMLTGSYKLEALKEASCPEGLKRCLGKAAAFDPKDRYPTAGEFERALSAALKKPRRRWGVIATIACLAAALGLFLCWPRGGGQVEFDNALLERAVRYELDKPEGGITYQDLERVERLAVVGRNILEREQNYRYRAFGYIDNVPQLDEPYGSISDLSPLAKMPNLRELYLCQQEITDLSPLKDLPLRKLYLPDNRIEDLTPLSGVNNLQVLCLGNNRINDLTPLVSLHRLEELNLDAYYDGWVDSFAPLAGLPVTKLSLNNTSPRDGDWSPLEEMDQVEELWLWNPPDAALSPLPEMDGLASLSVGDFQGQDLTGLNLPQLAVLSLSFHVNSLDGIEQTESLEWLDLSVLEKLSLEPLTHLKKLTNLSLNECRNMDYTPLLRVPGLENVEVWDEVCLRELERDCPEDIRTFQVTRP